MNHKVNYTVRSFLLWGDRDNLGWNTILTLIFVLLVKYGKE